MIRQRMKQFRQDLDLKDSDCRGLSVDGLDDHDHFTLWIQDPSDCDSLETVLTLINVS